MFDLPSMLGEYLLPLVLVVPLAVVLVLLASRNTDRDDPTRDRRRKRVLRAGPRHERNRHEGAP